MRWRPTLPNNGVASTPPGADRDATIRPVTQWLTPKQLALAIGVSESSVKRWADAGELEVSRTSGGHRRISATEALRFARRQGLTVADPAALGLGAAHTAPQTPAISAERLGEWLRAGEDERAVGALVSRFVAGEPAARMADELIAPALGPVGELWHEDAAGIAVEHRATEACVRAVNRIQALIPPAGADAPLALGGVYDADLHGLGSLIAAAVLADEGWRAINLGANLPLMALQRYADERSPRLVWLAATMVPSRRRGAQAALRELGARLREQGGMLVVGGRASAELVVARDPAVSRVDSFAELAALARGLHSREHHRRRAAGSGEPAA